MGLRVIMDDLSRNGSEGKEEEVYMKKESLIKLIRFLK